MPSRRETHLDGNPMTTETDFETVFEDVLTEVPNEQYDRDRFVPGGGPFNADIVLVGEAPGEQEVVQHEPFVGSAGDRLQSALDDIGLNREDVYVTNLVKIRPPENRDPHRDEIEAWKPVLEAELDHIDPTVVVPLGTFATHELLGTDESVSNLHGDSYERNGRLIIPTYHPAASFYDESKRDTLEADLRSAATNIESS